MGQHLPNVTEFRSMIQKLDDISIDLERAKNDPKMSQKAVQRRKRKRRCAMEDVVRAYNNSRREFFYSLRHDGHWGDCDYSI